MIQQQKKEVIGILRRIKNRDFSGNTGIAVKNSAFNLATSLVAKIGSIVFTVIIARMLMPELFGLYSLALSTIILLSTFADMGIGTALVRFLSKELGKKNGNPHKYYNFLFKSKLLLTLCASLVLLFTSYFIAHYYYNKPIFLALLAGTLYLLVINLMGFFSGLFQAYNNFKIGLYKEILFQIARLIIIPLVILWTISLSQELVLFWIFIGLTLTYAIALIYLYSKKEKYENFELSKKEKSEVLKFIIPLSVTGLSGMFFGYVDVIILGRFVESAFIGYYQAALTLVASTGALIGFSGALFPLYSRLKGKQLSALFRKSVMYTSILASGAIILVLLLADIGVKIIYGVDYLPSSFILKVLSLMVLLDSLISIYSSFLISQNRPLVVAKLLIFSTIINICLNYMFISGLVLQSHYYAVIGSAVATLIAKGIHLGLLVWRKNLFS